MKTRLISHLGDNNLILKNLHIALICTASLPKLDPLSTPSLKPFFYKYYTYQPGNYSKYIAKIVAWDLCNDAEYSSVNSGRIENKDAKPYPYLVSAIVNLLNFLHFISDMEGDDPEACTSTVFEDWKQLDLSHFNYHILRAHIL